MQNLDPHSFEELLRLERERRRQRHEREAGLGLHRDRRPGIRRGVAALLRSVADRLEGRAPEPSSPQPVRRVCGDS
jgi:hypothetical protein